MRLFLAIPVTGSARAGLETALERWRAVTTKPRWELPGDWHVTLKFIGAWPDTGEARLLAALNSQPWPHMRLRITGLGAFPSPRRPSILWAGVTPAAPLAAWAARIEAVVAPLGVAPERRPFAPHITLARGPTPGEAAAVLRGGQQPGGAWGEVDADGMALYQTLPDATPGTRYRIRHHFRGA